MSGLSVSPVGESRYASPGPLRDLVGDRIVLRPWRLDQAADLSRIVADQQIGQWNPVPAADETLAAAWIQSRREWTDHATWAVLGTDQTILGSISLFHLDPANAAGEVGYWVALEARGQGVAPRALTAVCAFAFADLGLERLELFHAVENTASCAAATKAGFILEGTLRSSYRYADGLLHDEHVHSRLPSD